MNTLVLSTSDIEGGAARAAYRLHQSLRTIGVNSQMLVRSKFSVDRAAIAHRTTLAKLGPSLDSLPLKLYPNRDRAMFSPQWFPDAIAPGVARLAPDLISLHWICNGYLQIETLAKSFRVRSVIIRFSARSFSLIKSALRFSTSSLSLWPR